MLRTPLSVFLATSLVLVGAACTNKSSNTEGDPASCGNIDVSAEASCTVEVEGGCTAQCTPVSFVAECSGRCDASLDVGCTGSCQGTCEAECTVEPGTFDCQASCEGNCQADCNGSCEGSSCEGQCAATCEGECSGSCEATPASADCTAKCQASCEGECHAEANLDCNIECQADLQGGCEIACESPDGALFCDGSYVDAGNNLAECIAYLNGILQVEVDASGSAACDNNACTAEASASCGNSIGPKPTSNSLPWYAAALAAAGLAIGTRRRRS